MKKMYIFSVVFISSFSLVNGYTTWQLNSANILAQDKIINYNVNNPAGYKLDQKVLRQEIAAVARWAGNIPKTTICMNSFWDVGNTHPNSWACYSIEALLENNVIASNSVFRPEAYITKAEWLGMLIKATCWDDYSYDSSMNSTWQEQLIEYASDNDIVDKFADYNTEATRGWVFEVWAQAMKSCEDTNNEIKINLPIGFEDELVEDFDDPLDAIQEFPSSYVMFLEQLKSWHRFEDFLPYFSVWEACSTTPLENKLNGNWVDIVCKDDTIVQVDYYLKGEIVSEDLYLQYLYLQMEEEYSF